MSAWDQCCKGGKFNAKFAETQRTVQTLRKIERQKEDETPAFPETSYKYHLSNAYADKKCEDFSAITTATNVETQFSFLDLRLNNNLLKWLESIKFSLPNRVQNEVLYRFSERGYKHNVIIAPEKSGKTSAALLWVLDKLLCDKKKEYPKALMICPTIEIVDSTYRFVEQVSNYSEIKIYSAMKGKKLNKGEQMTADLVIATPDKAFELLESTFNLKYTKYLIFDDAHCMSDAVGRLKTVCQVFSVLPARCRIILCTLFCNKVLEDFIGTYLLRNQRIEIENVFKEVIPKEIFIVYSSNEERVKAIIYLEKSESYKGQTVVFCQTKDESNRLKSSLNAEELSAEILNGNLKQAKRNYILQEFKENKIKLLITTYAYMEALEAENVSKVINYDQVLDDEFKLKRDIYGQIENRLNGRKNCLIGSFIEEKWEDYLIKPQPGSLEQVYANATRISVNDLIDGQNFNK